MMSRTSERLISFLVLLSIFFIPHFGFADLSVNINTADKAALMTLSGIGDVKAQAIIDYRNTNGSFQKKEDIMNVKGIGEATYNGIKDHIVVSGGSSSVSPSPSPSPAPSTSPSPSGPVQGIPASYVPPPEKTLFADAGGDMTVIVGAESEFSGRAYGKTGDVLSGFVRYSWNFGDGGTAEGQAVLHHFVYPGKYAVVLTVAQGTDSASDTAIIEAKGAQLRLTTSDGALRIENLSGSDIDISRWILSSGGKMFALPRGTIILHGAGITFSGETTHLSPTTGSALLFPNGTLAFQLDEGNAGASNSVGSDPSLGSAIAPQSSPSPSPIASRSAKKTIQVSRPEEDGAEPKEVQEESLVPEETPTTRDSSQVAAASVSVGGGMGWWLGALGLVTAVAGALVVSKRMSRNEWNIIEEKGEEE